MKEYIPLLLVSVLVVAVLYFFMIKDNFYTTPPSIVDAHTLIPQIPDDAIRNVQAGIINVIVNRPDVIDAISKVLSEPKIKRELKKMVR